MRKRPYGLPQFFLKIRIITFVIVIIYYSVPTTQQAVYKAAVVEYAPKREFDYRPRKIIIENTKVYVGLIQKAAEQGADIIIFPEYGLTTSEVTQKVSEHLESYGIKVPSTEKGQTANPCDSTPQSFHKALTTLSCAAKTNKIYIVINFVEKETINEDENMYKMYSTNVVFDRNGTLITKYRKINLHNDLSFNNGDSQEVGIFKTDFDVTFGLLIGADILYRNPALKLLENSQVKNIIYTTGWSSEIPFLNSLSLQHGYAKANKINLLTASLNDPYNNSTGGGIFLSDGSIVNVSISGLQETNLLIHNVFTNDESNRGQDNFVKYDANLITNTANEDMKNYTFEPLDFRITPTINRCMKNNSFCCFTISIDPESISNSNSVYKIASFIGARYFGSGIRTKTIGVAVCALVVCENETSTSCGTKTVSAVNLTFINISINRTYLPNNYFLQPTTLKNNLLPATNYTFYVQNEKTIISATNLENSVLSFGILGRIFDDDDKPAGPINYNVRKLLKKQQENNEELASTWKSIIIISVNVCLCLLVILVVFCYLRKRYCVRGTREERLRDHDPILLQDRPNTGQNLHNIV